MTLSAIRNLFGSAKIDKIEAEAEAETILPDDVTAYVLSFFSCTTLVTASRVCRQWNRLAKTPVVWENKAKYFPLKPYETEVPTAIKKQIYQHALLEKPAETEKEFFNKIKIICDLMKPDEVVGIYYKSASIAGAYFKLFMVKSASNQAQLPGSDKSNDQSFPELEKIARIYEIYGENTADFGLDRGPESSFGNNPGYVDIEIKYCKIKSQVTGQVIKTIKDQLESNKSKNSILNFFGL